MLRHGEFSVTAFHRMEPRSSSSPTLARKTSCIPPSFSPLVGWTSVEITTKDPKPLRELRADVPESLESAIMKALASDPDERSDSMYELAEALALCAGEKVSLPPRAAPEETGAKDEKEDHVRLVLADRRYAWEYEIPRQK